MTIRPGIAKRCLSKTNAISRKASVMLVIIFSGSRIEPYQGQRRLLDLNVPPIIVVLGKLESFPEADNIARLFHVPMAVSSSFILLHIFPLVGRVTQEILGKCDDRDYVVVCTGSGLYVTQ